MGSPLGRVNFMTNLGQKSARVRQEPCRTSGGHLLSNGPNVVRIASDAAVALGRVRIRDDGRRRMGADVVVGLDPLGHRLELGPAEAGDARLAWTEADRRGTHQR